MYVPWTHTECLDDADCTSEKQQAQMTRQGMPWSPKRGPPPPARVSKGNQLVSQPSAMPLSLPPVLRQPYPRSRSIGPDSRAMGHPGRLTRKNKPMLTDTSTCLQCPSSGPEVCERVLVCVLGRGGCCAPGQVCIGLCVIPCPWGFLRECGSNLGPGLCEMLSLCVPVVCVCSHLPVCFCSLGG